jgi:hypothetical protein
LVEAGLLENPVIFGQARFPNSSEESTNYEFGIAQNFLNILMQPARKRLSAVRFEQVKLQMKSPQQPKALSNWQSAYIRPVISVTLNWPEKMRILNNRDWNWQIAKLPYSLDANS